MWSRNAWKRTKLANNIHIFGPSTNESRKDSYEKTANDETKGSVEKEEVKSI